jgi:hypothetical protein
MGIAKAKGLIRADRLAGRDRRVVVMTGDGELQEGQIWESLATAVRDEMRELTVIVDHNRLQSDMAVARVSDLGDLEAKFAAFGWAASRCDGHDLGQLRAFGDARGRPAGDRRRDRQGPRGVRDRARRTARRRALLPVPLRCAARRRVREGARRAARRPAARFGRLGLGEVALETFERAPTRTSTSTASRSGSCPPTGRRCWRPAGATSGSWRSTPT